MTRIKPKRIIQRENPFRASERADDQGRATRRRAPARTAFFAEREVQNPDGSFPFGEGYLYEDAQVRARDDTWEAGTGRPADISVADHRGTKDEQQDAVGALRLRIGDHEGVVLVAADGVSASGPRAARASATAVQVFLQQLRRELADVPAHEARRHPYVERALSRAAFAANFEVIRQVLLDYRDDGRYGADDRRRLEREVGVELPTGRLTVAEMQRLAPQLDAAVAARDQQDASALTTFAVAVAVDNDLYTFSSGDAVVSLFRPSEPRGRRVIHLTDRDQAVVELFKEPADWRASGDLFENVITAALGDSGRLSGTLRRYPDLLEPGDRVIAHSDGLSPRDTGHGLDRAHMEEILARSSPRGAARALVKGQLEDLEPDDYQDNIGVVVLTVE